MDLSKILFEGNKMNTKAFVYLWYDAKNKMYYLGSSIGKKPSYAHSSTVMEKFTLKTKPPYIHRRILATGTHLEMKNLEKKLLDNRKERCWDKYYNKTTQFPPPPMRGENHPNFGKKLSLETRKKLSEANLGKLVSLETRKKLSEARRGKNNPNFGKKASLETRKKLSEAKSGENNPNFGRTGEASPMFGKKHTPETLKKLSEARRGENNPNTRKNREARREKAERLENA